LFCAIWHDVSKKETAADYAYQACNGGYSACEKHTDPDGCGYCKNVDIQGCQQAKVGGNPFPSTKFQPYGEHMSDNYCPHNRKIQRIIVGLKKIAGTESFESIQKERKNSKNFSLGSHHICGTNVPGSGFSQQSIAETIGKN
jgi:hypothetical protein